MIDESNYFILGIVTGIALCMLIGLAYVRVMWEVAKTCYAYGESSGYRRSSDLPPVHADGPLEDEHTDDIAAIMNQYVPGGEPVAVDDMDEPDTFVRVNLGGGVRTPKGD